MKLLALLLTLAAPAALAHSHAKKKAAEPEVKLEDVAEPKPNEVCFSPEEPCDLKLVRFVQGAQKSLDVAIYDINLDQLVHALAVAQVKKIQVRVLVDQRQSKGDHSLVGTLAESGVTVRYGKQRGIMHNKFILRDGAFLETGSFNFTNHAATANNENQIYLDHPDILARYRARFETIWNEATSGPSP